MIEFWNQLQGQVVDRVFSLREFLEASGSSALYLTQYQGRTAVLKLIDARNDPADQLARVTGVAKLSHPNLLQIFAAGRYEYWNTPLVYLVLETPDESLSQVLKDRSLDPQEAREVVQSALDGLSYVHSRGFVHGNVYPGNIVAVGNKIKLSSDTVFPQGGGALEQEPPVYPAPECAGRCGDAPADIWALGKTVIEILTGKPAGATPPNSLPEPFLTIARNCLQEDPQARWSSKQIDTYLQAPVQAISGAPAEPAKPASYAETVKAPAPKPQAQPATPSPAPLQRPAAATPPAASRRVPEKAEGEDSKPFGVKPSHLAVAGVAAACVLGLVLARKPAATPETAPAVQTQPKAATAKPAIPAAERARAGAASRAERPSPVRARGELAVARPAAGTRHERRAGNASAQTEAAGQWRVIAYTFNRYSDAEKRARSLERKRPQFKAEVFAPNGGRGPYLVSIGKHLSRKEAEQLQRRARSSGLPRDTYIRNYGS